MRLLFDQNLSRTLVQQLADVFPEAMHVQTAGLEASPDLSVWEFARQHAMAIVSKDSDFRFLASRPDAPKVILLELGNTTTREIADTLRASLAVISRFAESDQTLLVLTTETGRG